MASHRHIDTPVCPWRVGPDVNPPTEGDIEVGGLVPNVENQLQHAMYSSNARHGAFAHHRAHRGTDQGWHGAGPSMLTATRTWSFLYGSSRATVARALRVSAGRLCRNSLMNLRAMHPTDHAESRV